MKALRVVALLVAIALIIGQSNRSQAAPKTVVTWFIGLGTGLNQNELTLEKLLVASFNESHPDIELTLSYPNAATATGMFSSR